MGLFSTLLLSSGSSGSPDDEAQSSSSLLPTVLQMFADQPILLETVTTKVPSYAPLTFQAMHVPTIVEAHNNNTPATGLRKKAQVHVVPDLGVWNCRLSTSTASSSKKPLVDSLLPIPTTARTYCWKLDAKDPQLVEPTITLFQEALVRYLIQTSDSTQEATAAAATTSLFQLRSVQFGLAEKDTVSSSSAAPSPEDHNIKVPLQICVVWPTASSSEDYQRQQTLALLYYHLRRYAAALQATLVFVRDGEDTVVGDKEPSSSATDMQPLLTLPQLALVWKALARGEQVWKEDVLKELFEQLPDSSADEQQQGEQSTEEATTAAYSTVYGPDTATDLIETVLQRSANYPGHWDAATDSIWKILPAPEALTRAATASSSDTETGDQGWLKELRDSVAIPTENPAEKTPSKPTSKATGDKTPDVSDYFSQFLK